MYSTILISGSDLLKHWKWTHSLDLCSAILVSGSDLLKHWRNSLAGCVFSHSWQWFWFAQILEKDLQSGCVFSHTYQFWFAQTQEGDSQPGYVFSHSCKWLRSAQTLRDRLTFCICVQPFLSVVLIGSNTEKGLTRWICVAILVSSFDMLKH